MASKKPKLVNVAVARKKILVVGCSHGEFLNKTVAAELFRFKQDFKPDVTVHLGDFLDTTAWRSGASGTADETKSPRDDFKAAQGFLGKLEPNLVFIGNHDHRPYTYLDHPNALISDLAAVCVCDIRQLVRERLKAELVEGYDIRRSWRRIGDTLFSHGWMYNVNAARDHAEMMGAPVCIAHIHRIEMQAARAHGAPNAWAAGCLANIDELTYASRRRQTHQWRNGFLYGEFNEKETRLQPYVVKLERAIETAQCAKS